MTESTTEPELPPNESAPGRDVPHGERPAQPDESPADAPNESGPGHNPPEETRPGRLPKEDVESEQSFPASDPPANY